MSLLENALCFLACAYPVSDQTSHARSHIKIPGSVPFWALESPDRDDSKSDVYWVTLSGVNGGTRIGPPLTWACNGCAEGGGSGGAVMPSNLGNGPPARALVVRYVSSASS